jgi:hypothetical protein
LSNPRLITSLLNPCEQLLQHSRLLLRLQAQLDALIEPGLAGHYRIQNLRDGSLFLQTDAPVWATRLRYILPSLLERLRAVPGLEQLRDIQFSVSAPPPSNRHTVSRAAQLSPAAAQLLRDTADAIADPQLQQALRRLARNVPNDDTD